MASKTSTQGIGSTFIYCEDELPSCLDLGKHKYGGPFTTEQLGASLNGTYSC